MMNKNNQNDTKSGLNINFFLLLRIEFFMSVHKLKMSIDFHVWTKCYLRPILPTEDYQY